MCCDSATTPSTSCDISFLPTDVQRHCEHCRVQFLPLRNMVPRQHNRKWLCTTCAVGTPCALAASHVATLMFSQLIVITTSGRTLAISRRMCKYALGFPFSSACHASFL